MIAALPHGHADMVRLAVERMRQDYAQTPDPASLLFDPFTVKEMHEAVAGHPLMLDTFRRQMEPQLMVTGQMSDDTRGRPSRLWRRWEC